MLQQEKRNAQVPSYYRCSQPNSSRLYIRKDEKLSHWNKNGHKRWLSEYMNTHDAGKSTWKVALSDIVDLKKLQSVVTDIPKLNSLFKARKLSRVFSSKEDGTIDDDDIIKSELASLRFYMVMNLTYEAVTKGVDILTLKVPDDFKNEVVELFHAIAIHWNQHRKYTEQIGFQVVTPDATDPEDHT